MAASRRNVFSRKLPDAATPQFHTVMLQINGTDIQIRVHSVVKDAQFLATETIQISANYTDIGWAKNAEDNRLNSLNTLSFLAHVQLSYCIVIIGY